MLNRFLLVLAVVLAAVAGVHAQSSSEREIYTALRYGDEIFEPELWLASANEQTDRTTAIWEQNTEGALAYVELLHWASDAPDSQAEIEEFFTNDWFDGVFSTYAGWEPVGEACLVKDLHRWKFSLTLNDIEYIMYYWVKPLTSTRVLAASLVYPSDNLAQLENYANRWVPDTTRC